MKKVESQTKRTDSICCVSLCVIMPMYVEADTPEDAVKFVKEHIDDLSVDDFEIDDSGIEVHSYETYTTESSSYMDKIHLQDGRVLTFDQYVDELILAQKQH